MSLPEFPPLPKPCHSRKRSASDPACLTSTTGTETRKVIRALAAELAAMNDAETAKSQDGGSKGTRKDIGIAMSDGDMTPNAIGQHDAVQSTSVPNGAVEKPVSKAVTKETVANSITANTIVNKTTLKNAPPSNRTTSTVKASKDISKLSPAELKALSDPTVHHVKIATIDPALPISLRTPKIIHTSYPLPLLCAISPRIATILSSRTTPDSSGKTSTTSEKTSTTSASSTDTTLVGNSSPVVNELKPPAGLVLHTTAPTPLSLVLTYAFLASRHGSLTHPTARSLLSIPLTDCAFFKYGRIVKEARYLGFTYLETTILKRMRNIAAGQVHSNDVERMLANDAAAVAACTTKDVADETQASRVGSVGGSINSSESTTASSSRSSETVNAAFPDTIRLSTVSFIRQMAVTSIATALWEGRLQYKDKYDRLGQRYPEFNREVREVLQALDWEYGYH